MTKNSKLNDLQLILLATAVQRDDGNLYPLPGQLLDQTERVQKAIPALLRRQLVSEVPATDLGSTWREDGDQRLGLVITDIGRAAIKVSEDETAPRTPETGIEVVNAQKPSNSAPRAGSKAEMVLNMLTRQEGATLAELVEATGWLPHTTRAALTGLRKKGHAITKTSRDGVTVYQIVQA